MPTYWKYTFLLLATTLLLSFLALFSFADDRLHLIFCDVGQGDAILVYQRSTQVLVDGGPDSAVLSCLSDHMPFWDRTIELVVLTHPDADHYGGLVDVVRRYHIVSFAGTVAGKNDYGFKTLMEEVKGRPIDTIILQAGKTIKIGKFSFAAIWPTKEYLARLAEFPLTENKVLGATEEDSVNEFSIVLHLQYGGFDALLTGDIQPPVTDLVSERVGEVEVLKVPHHGSKNGLTEALLQASGPKLAVISAGKNNRYGHPHKEILEALERWKVRYLRTDLDGEVEIVTDGKGWFVKQ